ncbi:MAG: hypothetical protein QG597_2485 [Actinomycetota bacterium]|nr:hypothetical protein [Actinomycetota bacterium]
MRELDFGLSTAELILLGRAADQARVSCEGGSEGDLG